VIKVGAWHLPQTQHTNICQQSHHYIQTNCASRQSSPVGI